MNVSFYLDNKTLPDMVDPLEYLESNPGIGGTEYAILTISYLLSREEGFKVSLYVTKQVNVLNCNYNIVVIENIVDAINKADGNNDDILIFPNVGLSQPHLIKDVKHTVKLVLWCHLFCSKALLDFFAKNHIVDWYINVGEEELDTYRDHLEYEKSDYIYNGIHVVEDIGLLPRYVERKNVVTYIGNIKPYKGFHVLAKAWKKVIKEIPDAELNVIGSGRLYDRSVRLGKYNIATEEYENQFMPYLTDENGDILKSVHFLGIMGREKFDILKNTKVGVPNPSGVSETFGYSAVEMQMMGCLCTTKLCPGYLDTILPTGILYENEDQLAECIIELLRRVDNQIDSSVKGLRSKFSFEVIIDEWVRMLTNIYNNEGKIHKPSNKNMFYRLKCLKDVVRKCKHILPCLNRLPLLEYILTRIKS